MAPGPRIKRLDAVQFEGRTPKIRITNEQFEHLSKVYGVALPKDAQKEIRFLANHYLFRAAGELVSHDRSERNDLHQQVKAALGPFFKFAAGGVIPQTPAGYAFMDMLEEHYRTTPIHLLSRYVSVVHEDGSSEPVSSPGRVAVKLNQHVL